MYYSHPVTAYVMFPSFFRKIAPAMRQVYLAQPTIKCLGTLVKLVMLSIYFIYIAPYTCVIKPLKCPLCSEKIHRKLTLHIHAASGDLLLGIFLKGI